MATKKSKKKKGLRLTASEENFMTLKPTRPTREQLENEVQFLRQQVDKRTPVEQAAQNVDILRNGVSESRVRINQLETELQEERSRLSATMLAHGEATSKLKEMTALNHQVP